MTFQHIGYEHISGQYIIPIENGDLASDHVSSLNEFVHVVPRGVHAVGHGVGHVVGHAVGTSLNQNVLIHL